MLDHRLHATVAEIRMHLILANSVLVTPAACALLAFCFNYFHFKVRALRQMMHFFQFNLRNNKESRQVIAIR